MKSRGSRTRGTWGLAGFLLVLVAALGAQAQPPSSKLPGRKQDSREPWGAFLKLSWRTPEPGVTLYRWSYRRKKPGATWKERAAQKEEELPGEEVEQRGELAGQAIRAAYEGGERPRGFEGQVYLPADCR